MRAGVPAAIALMGLLAVRPAGATAACPQSWYRKAEGREQRWLGGPARADRDVVRPPPGIDPRMALTPPGPPGAMRIIRPRQRPEQR
jgi:hypothetical protein